MATICVSRIGFEGRHGATAAERRTSRRFEVDLEMDVPLARAEASDRLADTVDYAGLCELIVGIGTAEPHRLLESLARRMVTALAARVPEARIRLELRKLSPPYCAGNPAFAAVRVTHPV